MKYHRPSHSDESLWISPGPDYAPRTPQRRGLLEPIGNLFALACMVFATLALIVLHDRYVEPEPEPLATMEDVVRWTEQGCDTDSDCESWSRWAELVCENREACDAARGFGSLPPYMVQ